MIKNIPILIASGITLFGLYAPAFAQEKRPEDAMTPTSELDGTPGTRNYLPGERPSEHKDLIDDVKKQPTPTVPKKDKGEDSESAPSPLVTPFEPTKPDESADAVKESEKKDDVAPTPEANVSADDPSHRFAVGFNLAWTTTQDYGARTFRRLTPEIIGFTYGALPWEEMWWRLGARVGYSSDQPEMPQAVRLEETDTTTLIEAAITRDWYVVPTFAVGGGYDFRKTKVKISAPIDSADDRLNRKETLWMWYAQGGLGLPLLKARILLEPTVRYHTIQYDSRSHWMFGIEMTIGI